MFSCLHSAKVHEGRLGSKRRVSCIPSRNHPINTNKTPRSRSKGWTGRERALEEIQVRPGNEKRQEVLTVKIQQWKTASVYSYSRSREGGRKRYWKRGTIDRRGCEIREGGGTEQGQLRQRGGREKRYGKTKMYQLITTPARRKKIPKCNFQVRDAGTGRKRKVRLGFHCRRKLK